MFVRMIFLTAFSAVLAVCAHRSTTDVSGSQVVKALIEDVKAVRKIDARQIYITGISNGGFMVQRLACDLSGRIAAFAGVAGGSDKQGTECYEKDLEFL
jgi:poly(3-hydroxybutyrate) depolymerase